MIVILANCLYFVLLIIFFIPLMILSSRPVNITGGARRQDTANWKDRYNDCDCIKNDDWVNDWNDSAQTTELHKITELTKLRKIAYSVKLAEIEVRELNIPDVWKYTSTNWPDEVMEHKNDPRVFLQDKIWWIKRNIRYKTHWNQSGRVLGPGEYKMPDDLCAIKGIFTEPEMKTCYEDLEKIFKERNKLGVLQSDQTKGRGLIYLFTGDQGVIQKYSKTVSFLEKYNTRLLKFIQKYVKYICNIYDIHDNELDNFIQVIPLQYQKPNGIWLHIDNIARYEGGPIITLGLGPEYSYYDFAPSLLSDREDLKPIRFKIRRGDIAIMDGSARMEWSHGLPYETPYKEIKYTIMIKCNRLGVINERYNKVLDTTFTTSAQLC